MGDQSRSDCGTRQDRKTTTASVPSRTLKPTSSWCASLSSAPRVLRTLRRSGFLKFVTMRRACPSSWSAQSSTSERTRRRSSGCASAASRPSRTRWACSSQRRLGQCATSSRAPRHKRGSRMSLTRPSAPCLRRKIRTRTRRTPSGGTGTVLFFERCGARRGVDVERRSAGAAALGAVLLDCV
ncbi:hypothetical protein VHUM_01353 [Vanrija humicola]|uniref:Uncharacterized protein n=1 Tax=Vanrija humicola TaxID=5417 RepID=A0A7D8Z4Y8_VANHU|nr:hypothetical protein VHUM_01353 [Vanrija humicola]